jgi:hypothetical protein
MVALLVRGGDGGAKRPGSVGPPLPGSPYDKGMIGRSISLFFCIALLGGLGIANAQLTDPRLELQPVVSGLTLPTSLVFVGPD